MAFTKVKTRDIGEAIYAGNHNFEVETVPLMMPNGNMVPDKKATQVKGTGEYLGTVGKDYRLIQPMEFYELAQRFMEETGAVIDQTITLKAGACIGLSMKVATQEYVSGDPIELNFIMMTSFNMQYSLIGRAISQRLFCMNQLPNSNSLFDIKHTTYASQRVGMALRMVGFYGKEQATFNDKMKALVKYPMTERAMVDWFTGLLPKPIKGSKRSNSIHENTRSKFVELLNSGMGVEVPGVRGTGYHALNALTEFVNHHRSTRVKAERDPAEVKWESTLFGSGNQFMQKGFNKIVDMVLHEPSDTYVGAHYFDEA